MRSAAKSILKSTSSSSSQFHELSISGGPYFFFILGVINDRQEQRLGIVILYVIVLASEAFVLSLKSLRLIIHAVIVMVVLRYHIVSKWNYYDKVQPFLRLKRRLTIALSSYPSTIPKATEPRINFKTLSLSFKKPEMGEMSTNGEQGKQLSSILQEYVFENKKLSDFLEQKRNY